MKGRIRKSVFLLIKCYIPPPETFYSRPWMFPWWETKFSMDLHLLSPSSTVCEVCARPNPPFLSTQPKSDNHASFKSPFARLKDNWARKITQHAFSSNTPALIVLITKSEKIKGSASCLSVCLALTALSVENTLNQSEVHTRCYKFTGLSNWTFRYNIMYTISVVHVGCEPLTLVCFMLTYTSQ